MSGDKYQQWKLRNTNIQQLHSLFLYRDLRQEIQKCFWSQILMKKIGKSYCTTAAIAKWQTGGDLKQVLSGKPMKMSEWHWCQMLRNARTIPMSTHLLCFLLKIVELSGPKVKFPAPGGFVLPTDFQVSRGTWLCQVSISSLISKMWNWNFMLW